MRAQHVDGTKRIWINAITGEVAIWVFDFDSSQDESFVKLPLDEAQKLLMYINEAIEEATFQAMEKRHASSS